MYGMLVIFLRRGLFDVRRARFEKKYFLSALWIRKLICCRTFLIILAGEECRENAILFEIALKEKTKRSGFCSELLGRRRRRSDRRK